MALEETVPIIANENPINGWSSTEDLLSTVDDLAPQYNGKQEDIDFLKQFIRSKEFQHLMNIHDKVQDVSTENEHCQPLTLLHMVLYDLEENITSKECEELYKHLNSVHVHAAVVAYDKIANRDYLPIPSNPDEFKKQEESDPIMTVRVDKQENEALGVTVKSDVAGNILISRVIHGTVADRCGLLRVGDVIHEVNGHSIHGKDIDDIAEEMSKLYGTIVFKVSSKQEYSQPQLRHQSPTFMKPLFNYNPSTDSDLPCTEAGLGFKKGDILVVLNQDDPHWWQAKLIDSTKVGLIPSSRMRERWEYRSTLSDSTNRRRNKTKKVEYSPLDCEEQGGQEITTYEEVVQIEPQTLHPRPIVLIAPNCEPFSMAELKSRLIKSNPFKFGEPILTTTRIPKDNEIEDERFHFVSKEEFIRNLQSKQVIDYVEYEGDYYGTYIHTIRNTMFSGKTCVLTLRPKVLKIVHQMAEIKPYVIFFTPPENPLVWTNNGTAQHNHFERAKQEAKEMESRYGQYFDRKIVYSNVERAFVQVQRTTEELMTKPQWVPTIWTA